MKFLLIIMLLLPPLMAWQVDRVSDPQKIKLEAEKMKDVVCISALSGSGLDEFCNAVQEKLKVMS